MERGDKKKEKVNESKKTRSSVHPNTCSLKRGEKLLGRCLRELFVALLSTALSVLNEHLCLVRVA